MGVMAIPPLDRRHCLAAVLAASLSVAGVGCANPVVPRAPNATWPSSPELLPPANSRMMAPDFGRATWALDPRAAAPDVASVTLNILVWEMACSSGSPTSGRMSVPVIDYEPATVTITIGVRPLGGMQTCPGPPGTPAVVQLAEPLGNRVLLDGGLVPPAPPEPRF